MDPNIASITELLEYLSTRFYNVEQELKSNREHLDRIDRETTENVSENTPRPENHTLRYSVQLDHDEMNLQNIKPEALTFNDQLDPQTFLYWALDMNHYFNWSNMSNKRLILFTQMKLVGQARQYWANVEKFMTLKRQEPIKTWDEMKIKTPREIFACIVQTALT